jgi:hypothetical protein
MKPHHGFALLLLASAPAAQADVPGQVESIYTAGGRSG